MSPKHILSKQVTLLNRCYTGFACCVRNLRKHSDFISTLTTHDFLGHKAGVSAGVSRG